MISSHQFQCLVVTAVVSVTGLLSLSAGAADFVSTRPMPRVEYWQQRQATIDMQVADDAKMAAVKLLFVGDSITDFWLLGEDPWIPSRVHGRKFWDETFGGCGWRIPGHAATGV